jgi:hypothetical protein
MEDQMATATQNPDIGQGSGFISEEVRRLTEHARAERERKKQALNLQKSNILSQKTSNPARRAALLAALEQIEGEIQAFN